MNRTSLVLTLGLATLAATAPHARQIVINEQRITTGVPVGAGRGAPTPLPMGTGLIVGQVVEDGSASPIPGVLVTLSLPGSSPLRVLADGQGRFAFRDLPKGRYNITASKAGFVDGAHGRVRPGGSTQPINLEEGERLGGISIPVWKFAAVAGYVTDENGEPAIGAQVRVLKRSIHGGQWRLTPGPTDLTDDRGSYRIGALEPGDYVVAVPMSQGSGISIDSVLPIDGARDVVTMASVTRVAATAAAAGGGGGPVRIETVFGGGGAVPPPDANGRPQAYPTQFFPAASSSSRAAIVAIGSGEERSGVDFQLHLVRTMRVAGTIVGPDGPIGNLPVTLVPADAGDLATSIETLTAFSDGAGNFTFAAVPAGQYVLHASRTSRAGVPMEAFTQIGGGGMIAVRAISVGRGAPPLPDQPTLWTQTTVAVDEEDIGGLVLSLRQGLKVTGQVQFDGTSARPPSDQLPAISVSLEPATPVPGGPSGSIRGLVDASGRFETMGVPPGRYFVRVAGAPQNWFFRGAMLGGQDVSDVPLEIESGDATGVMLTFTDRSADLSGQVTGGSGEPVTVIVFPADSNAWVGYGSTTRRLRSVRADSNGNYTAQNLPPGDYLVAAVPDKLAGDWMNPKFLESLASSAARVRIGAGDKLTQNVQVAR